MVECGLEIFSLHYICLEKGPGHLSPADRLFHLKSEAAPQIKITEILLEDLSQRLTVILPPEREMLSGGTSVSRPRPSNVGDMQALKWTE